MFGSSRSSNIFTKIQGQGQTQGQGHLKEKYSDSNSSNDFAQNQHADCSWHAEFENHDHFFPRSKRLTLRDQNTAYLIKSLFMNRFEKFGHQCVCLAEK